MPEKILQIYPWYACQITKSGRRNGFFVEFGEDMPESDKDEVIQLLQKGHIPEISEQFTPRSRYKPDRLQTLIQAIRTYKDGILHGLSQELTSPTSWDEVMYYNGAETSRKQHKMSVLSRVRQCFC